MLLNRKKSPASEGKRKTRASDKVRTSQRKSKKSKSSASVNDGSYLQLQVQQQVPVSTVTSTTQPSISVSTGQAILDMLNKLDASNQELSRKMDSFECTGSVSSTPLTSLTIPPINPTNRGGHQHSVFPVHTAHQNLARRPTTSSMESHGFSTVST